MGTLAFLMDLSFPRLQTRQRYDSSLCQSLALWPFEHIITRLSIGLLPLYCTIKPFFNSLENPKEVRHVHCNCYKYAPNFIKDLRVIDIPALLTKLTRPHEANSMQTFDTVHVDWDLHNTGPQTKKGKNALKTHFLTDK